MNKNEIMELIKSGESDSLEFKENFDKESIETTSAFANTKGGVIIIGVSDKGKIKGISIGKATLCDWLNQISQSTEPRLVPEIEQDRIEGKEIAIIRIKEYPVKPISVKGRCFRRVSNSNRIMSTQEISEMHINSISSSWDAFPAREASMDDIDLEKVKRYIKKTNKVGRRKIADEDNPRQVLEKLELIKNRQVTWASILLFRKDTKRFLSQAAIHCGRFKEETVIIDDRMIEGTIMEQIEEVMDFIRKNTNVRFVITGKPTRDEIWDYPLEALREAVVNAVCHRDYADNSEIQLKIHDNRLTIWNPGGLPFGMTIDELYNPNHSSRLRNKLIGQIFYDVELIEKYGSGIERIMNFCKKAGLPIPLFEEKFGGFLVVFNKDIFSEEYLKKLGFNNRQIKAVIHLKEKEKITNREYQALNLVKRRLAAYELDKLTKKKIIERVGKVGKGTYYQLKRK